LFIGHFAVGLAAKRAVPRLSLAALFAGAQLADIIWPVLVAFGVERVRIDPGNTAFTPLDFVSYPYSHSLALLAVWGVVFGWIVTVATGVRRAFGVIVALVLSHWVLDWVTHRPDRSEEHTSELQSRQYLVCRLLLEKKKKKRSGIFKCKKN